MVFKRFKKEKTLEEQLQDEISTMLKEEKRELKQVGINSYFRCLMGNISTYGRISEDEKQILQHIYDGLIDATGIMNSKTSSTGEKIKAALGAGAREELLLQADARYRVIYGSTNRLAAISSISLEIFLDKYMELS